MREALFTALFFVCCAPQASAQGEFQRGEFGVMFSHNRVDDDEALNLDLRTDRDGFNGVNIDAGYNFTRYVGAKADFSIHRESTEIFLVSAGFGSAGTERILGKLAQLMGGVKLQDNSMKTRVRPFAQALFGIAHVDVESSSSLGKSERGARGLAAAFGGGLDVRVHRNIDFRAVKVEYNPVRLEGETDNNIRLGVGFNFRF